MANTVHRLSHRRHIGMLRLLVAAALLLAAAAPMYSAEAERTVIVGTKVTPPFAMKRADGTWYGIAIDLWQEIMTELGTEFRWREVADLQGLIESVTSGSIDAAVAALTITAPREKEMDFSHPYYRTGLSIAVKAPRSRKFLLAATILALSFFAIGAAMWCYDWVRHRRSNRTAREIRTGFLLVALVVIISSLIAHIITFVNLSTRPINGPEDLKGVTVATVPFSTSESYLQEHGIRHRAYPNLAAGLQAVSNGAIDALLYDTALLRYLARTDFPDRITVLPLTFELQEYGIAFPSGSGFREEVNQNLIAIVQSRRWHSVVEHYLAEVLDAQKQQGAPSAMISSSAGPSRETVERKETVGPET